MSAALAVLLAVLKILGILLLVLLALLLVVLCIPVAADFAYKKGAVTLVARYGPLKLPLYPTAPHKEAKKPAAKPAKAKSAKRKPEKAAPAAPAQAPPPAQAAAAPPEPDAKPKKTAKAAKAGAEGEKSSGGPLQAYLRAFRDDPLTMLEATLGHVAFAGGRLLHGVHVRALQVYWTVTDAHKDAAATALQYSVQLAALNNLLARARQHMEIQSDFLWLEPDFTGEKRAGRGISCRITLRPLVIVVLAPRLLWRLWRDPTFRGILH